MKKEYYIIIFVTTGMLVYFLLGHPVMMDDGFHYEGFTESLSKGKLDFRSFYGFQGLSFFAVPVFWLTRSHDSIIITSIIFFLVSISLAYFVGKKFYQSSRSGIYFLILFLLTPYPYTTMMRGFQEAAFLFFILLIIYGSLNKKPWTPMAWAIGGIVKPFALTLFPLFLRVEKRHGVSFIHSWKKMAWLLVALIIGGVYLGTSYYQTGHIINNAAINSYQGNFDTGNPPPLVESFTLGVKGFLRVGANLFLYFRKILLSPLVIILGSLALLKFKELKLRRRMIMAILFNIILVGGLTFSFSKYL